MGEAAALQALMQRQLPQITQRLNATLDKLRAPQHSDVEETDGKAWWDSIAQRYGARHVRFESEVAPGALKIPAELFDSVASNLIENALKKNGGGPVAVRYLARLERKLSRVACPVRPAGGRRGRRGADRPSAGGPRRADVTWPS